MRWKYSEILNFSVLLLSFLYLRFSNCEDGQLCSQVSVQRKQEKQGFHRDLITNLDWNISSLSVDPQNCQLLVVENLPSGMYVDINQIKNAVGFGGPEVFCTESMDVEMLADRVSSKNVFVFPKTAFDPRLKTGLLIGCNKKLEIMQQFPIITQYVTSRISIPIHLRYHRPVSGKRFVSVFLSSPRILGRCHGKNELHTQCKSTRTMAPCNARGDAMCEWFTLSTSVKSSAHSTSGQLHFAIPVGQKEHGWTVIVVTVLSTFIGSTWLLWTLSMTVNKTPS